MIWIITARRQLRIVSKDLANFENSGGRAAISLLFSKTRPVLPQQTRAPGQPVLSKQHRKRSSHSGPLSVAWSLKQSQLPTHRVPSRRDCEDQLRAIIGNALRERGDGKEQKQTSRQPARDG